MRSDGRKAEELRPVRIIPGYVEMPAGSALVEFGKTRVLCTASVEDRLPAWLHQAQLKSPDKSGWITSEYSILPGAGSRRTRREATVGKASGRTLEIQRLIGRSFRAVADLSALGPRTVWVDCDVIQADGGTRTAAITGGFVALFAALRALKEDGAISEIPIREHLAAVSVGVFRGEVILDLDYLEDSDADVDCNVVMTENGELVEVQATGEKKTFPREHLELMLDYAGNAIGELIELQKDALRIDQSTPVG